MRTTLPILALSLTLGVTHGGETRDQSGDLTRLQGRWTARAGARRELNVVLEVRGQSIKVAITTPQGLEIKVRGGVKLNETTAPRSLDWVDLLGPDRQPFPQVAGIYKLEGGTFTVCNGGFLGARPSEFESGDGALADVVVFHRLEAGRPGEAASAGSSPRRDSPPASPNGGSPEVSRVDRPGDVRR